MELESLSRRSFAEVGGAARDYWRFGLLVFCKLWDVRTNEPPRFFSDGAQKVTDGRGHHPIELVCPRDYFLGISPTKLVFADDSGRGGRSAHSSGAGLKPKPKKNAARKEVQFTELGFLILDARGRGAARRRNDPLLTKLKHGYPRSASVERKIRANGESAKKPS